MKSIARNFRREMNKDENIGEYPALVRAVQYKKYSRTTLYKNLCLLNEKGMDASMKKQLVDHLYKQTQKDPEEEENEGKNVSGVEKIEYLNMESSKEIEV